MLGKLGKKRKENKMKLVLSKKEIKMLLNVLSEYLDENSQGEISEDQENKISTIGDKLYALYKNKSMAE